MKCECGHTPSDHFEAGCFWKYNCDCRKKPEDFKMLNTLKDLLKRVKRYGQKEDRPRD